MDDVSRVSRVLEGVLLDIGGIVASRVSRGLPEDVGGAAVFWPFGVLRCVLLDVCALAASNSDATSNNLRMCVYV